MQERMQQEVASSASRLPPGRDGDSQDGWPQELLAVKIDPEVAGDVEMLQDMVVAAAMRP